MTVQVRLEHHLAVSLDMGWGDSVQWWHLVVGLSMGWGDCSWVTGAPRHLGMDLGMGWVTLAMGDWGCVFVLLKECLGDTLWWPKAN